MIEKNNPQSTTHTGSAAPEASQQLAEIVLSMQMTTDKGLVARRLARQVLGIDEQGRGPDLVPITTNGTTRLIPRDEPVFLIRGQDAAGAATVRAWADMADALGADSEILRVAREHADKMDVWPKKKTADLPQGSPSPSPAPSPVSGADERAQFEAWWVRDVPEVYHYSVLDRQRSGDGYLEGTKIRDAWDAWQARAALAPTPTGQQALSDAAAPQAVALTDEQIEAAWFKAAGHGIASGRLLDDAKRFARALLAGSA